MYVIIKNRHDFERYNTGSRIERSRKYYAYGSDMLVINNKYYQSFRGQYYRVDALGFTANHNLHMLNAQHIASLRRLALIYKRGGYSQDATKCLQDARDYMYKVSRLY